MAKDPAMLWYWNDWHGGTVTFSRHLKGCYMDILYAQFNNGHLSLDEIKTVLGSDFGTSWPTLQKKFVKDNEGLYYNVKAEETKNKRSAFTASRRVNGEGHMGTHMENEIENRKLKFLNELQGVKGDFSENLISDFKGYWLEMNKSGTKFRFEDQKFFDFKKRLQTFLRNDTSLKYKTENTELAKVDKSLTNEIKNKYADRN